MRVIWPRSTPRDRATVVLGIRPYFDAGWFNYPKYIAQDLLVVVVSVVAPHSIVDRVFGRCFVGLDPLLRLCCLVADVEVTRNGCSVLFAVSVGGRFGDWLDERNVKTRR